MLISAVATTALSILLVACAGRVENPNPNTRGSSRLDANAVVDRVVDGDTIIVDSHGEKERVRLIGVDTPESVHPSKPVECFGAEASTHTAELLPRGTPVHLKKDAEVRDRYGRLLAYVFRVDDGTFVNLELVQNGFANAYRFPPNVALAEQFSLAQSQARQAGAGLWSVCPDLPKR